MKTKNLVLAAAFAAIGFTSTQASAALVTQWKAVVTSDWVQVGEIGQPTWTGATGGTTFVSSDVLSWGATGGNHVNQNLTPINSRSALTIQGSPTAALFVDTGLDGLFGDTENTTSVTHWNNVIDGTFKTLTTATLRSTLTLTPNLPVVGSEFAPVSQDFLIRFTETPNAGTCAWDPFIGTAGYAGCSDVFVLPAEDLLFSFPFNDYFYTVEIGAAGLGLLPAGACTAANAGANCIGIITKEGTDTTALFNVRIASMEVPEPATLALLGLGLLGLGAASRRRKEG